MPLTTALLAASLATTAAPAPAMPEGTVLSARNVPIQTGARREVWIEGLEHPWGLAFLPDGSALGKV
jgi:glucose/arabinose dehydrogenase